MSNKDSLGDRMKFNYENRTRISLPRRTYTIIRLDGKSFHNYTKTCKRPFDKVLMDTMNLTGKVLCEEIQGCQMAYVQSDEISLLLTDFENPMTDAWFNGNIQKITSISAAIACIAFNREVMELLSPDPYGDLQDWAMFDSRVFTIPDPIEVENYFIWRQQDATRNSIQMAAQAVCSHKSLQGANQAKQHDLMHEQGINWNDYSPREKRGGICVKIPTHGWKMVEETPIFTTPEGREFLRTLIPKYEF